MKKILFFIPTLGEGGAEKVLVNLVNNMDYKKYEVTVQTLFDVGINKEKLNKKVEYKYVIKKMFRGNIHIFKLFTPQFLFKKMIRSEYNIIVSYLEGPTTRIIAGCTNENTKIINWVHTEMKNEREFFNSYRSKKEMKKVYEKYDKTIFVSKEAKESFLKKCEYNINNDIVENVIDTNEIIKLSKEHIENEKISKDTNIKLITIGRLIKLKGYERLINIHKKLIDEGIIHSLYILGKGSEYKRLKKIIKQNKIEKTVCLCGFQKNPYKYLKNGDIYVCSSYKEGYNTAIIEALMLEKTIITTNCSGMNEILDNGKYGMIVKNEEESLYKGIKILLQNENLRKNYQIATKEGKTKFEIQQKVKEIEKLLEDE